MNLEQTIASHLIELDRAAVDSMTKIRSAMNDPHAAEASPKPTPAELAAWRKGLADALTLLKPVWHAHASYERWRTGAPTDTLSVEEREAFAELQARS